MNNSYLPKLLLFAVITVLYCTDSKSQSDTLINRGNFEYMTIISKQFDSKTNQIYISKPKGEYEKIRYDANIEKKRFDYKPLIELLEMLDKDGWIVVSSNITYMGKSPIEDYCTYYLLKRKKSK